MSERSEADDLIPGFICFIWAKVNTPPRTAGNLYPVFVLDGDRLLSVSGSLVRNPFGLIQRLQEEICVIGASRTDSGVHAIGNVAVFDTNTKIPADKMAFVLNKRLPEDIRIQESKEVDLYFHPRRCNSKKTYEYQILNRRFHLPLKRLYSQFAYVPLDVEKMKSAAKYLLGEHDFQSFCSARSQAEHTYRTIYSLDVEKEGDMITIRICGNGFLYNMVRIIVGTLTKVGMGVYPPEYVEEIW